MAMNENNITYYVRVYEKDNIKYGQELDLAQYITLEEFLTYIEELKETYKDKVLSIIVDTILNGDSIFSENIIYNPFN